MILQISAKHVKELRDKTGAGMMDCKKALQESQGDTDKAIEVLRKKGIAIANKKSNRLAVQGIIESYIHLGAKIGVMIELNCETDFVARRPEFQALAKNITMQIAASPNICYIEKEDIPKDFIDNEYKIESKKDDLLNKPDSIKRSIIQGRVEKRLSELSLFSQPFIKEPDITIKDLIEKHIALLGENIKVRRFIRFVLGDFIL
uniref:Elongation factor Ts, mitochondrial n=1 Tax=Hildenbrandia rubra TaxID=31481 RepID=A0A1C9CFY5_9FLOR|nr:elongation factor Ts [Hildenbrandia rubra]AOM67285.1 elongation factor Ts [Hildenbrandia rubra]